MSDLIKRERSIESRAAVQIKAFINLIHRYNWEYNNTSSREINIAPWNMSLNNY